MNIIKQNFLTKYKVSPLYIKPRNEKNSDNDFEEDLTLINSPCLKRQKSLASTIGSPYTRSYKSEEEQPEEINEFTIEKTCFNFAQKGYCLNGIECNEIHINLLQENKFVTGRNQTRSTMLQNFPELLISLPSQQIKLFNH